MSSNCLSQTTVRDVDVTEWRVKSGDVGGAASSVVAETSSDLGPAPMLL
ncbi:hypothetical protein X975_01227, partial [Stegodyphus mimosarum]